MISGKGFKKYFNAFWKILAFNVHIKLIILDESRMKCHKRHNGWLNSFTFLKQNISLKFDLFDPIYMYCIEMRCVQIVIGLSAIEKLKKNKKKLKRRVRIVARNSKSHVYSNYV